MPHAPAAVPAKTLQRHAPISLPQSSWLILLALAIGFADGLSAPVLVDAFGAGFGRALGSFALILIPSFVLAACLAERSIDGAAPLAAAIAPVTAAAMVCPDTAYAALAPVARHRKLSVAFGSHIGYRLLFPAGPLIVATGLGVDDSGLVVTGLALLVPTWLAGELWARWRRDPGDDAAPAPGAVSPLPIGPAMRALLPLAVLACLLLVGSLAPVAHMPLLDFATRPKGALLVAAALAVIDTEPSRRRECLEAAVRRSASLLLVIGAASAFGHMLTGLAPIGSLAGPDIGAVAVLLTLFALTAIVKLTHGSSTVSLATATPIVAPLALGAGVSPTAAVFAICLGSLLVMPTDSFYWLVRSDALADHPEKSALATLGGGVLVQAIVGMSTLLALDAMGLA